MASMKIRLYKQYFSRPTSICLFSLSCLFIGFIRLLDPHCQSDLLHPYKVCLILGMKTVMVLFLILFIAHQAGRVALLSVQLSHLHFGSGIVLHPPILPSHYLGSLLILARVLHSSCLCSYTNNILLVTAVYVSNSTASSGHCTAQCPPLSHVFLPSNTRDHPYKILQIIISLQLPALAFMPPQSKICVLSKKNFCFCWHAASAIFL